MLFVVLAETFSVFWCSVFLPCGILTLDVEHAEQTAMATAVFIRTEVQDYAGHHFLQNLLENTINSLMAVHFPSSGIQMPYINVHC